jgi:arsenate reductase-like glutaredoxin family protein
MTCKKAQEFLARVQVPVRESVNASKVRYGPQEALGLLQGIARLVVTRGQKVEQWDLRQEKPTEEELLRHLLGPTGNLRAPTARVGTTLIVGFQEAAYREVLGL